MTYCNEKCSVDPDCPKGFHCIDAAGFCAPDETIKCKGNQLAKYNSCGYELAVVGACKSGTQCVDGKCESLDCGSLGYVAGQCNQANNGGACTTDGANIWKCVDAGAINCWKQSSTCLGDSVCLDTESAAAVCIDNGHSSFCSKKKAVGSGCKHGQGVCNTDSQCLGGLVCVDKKICCNEGEIEKDGQCAPGCSCAGKQCGDDGCGKSCGTCDSNASCKDPAGTGECVCNNGYTGSGIVCADVDECTAIDPAFDGSAIAACKECICGQDAFCCDTSWDQYCDSCAEGQKTPFCEGLKCLATCAPPTVEKCPANSVCSNTVGGYQCVCEEGYYAKETQCVAAGTGEQCEPCTDKFDCKAGYKCNYWTGYPDQKFCAKSCSQTAECPSAHECNSVTKSCMPVTGNECKNLQTVIFGDACGNELETVDICVGNESCQAGECVCEEGYYAKETQCVAAGTGEQCKACTDKFDCAWGYKCQYFSNYPDVNWCAKQCAEDADCAEGLYCG
ncbi:MAG TPA: hypothetical protein EYN66_22010, partial [Myxococcales bacterium]|nr:hypothetical protein [Myxococcales bacterium]